MQWLDQFTFVDQANVAIYGCGLGTEAAIATGVLHDGLKGLVLQQLPQDDRVRYESGTEQPGRTMTQDVGKWHILPGKMTMFGWQDLCAAFAPRHLSLNEGGSFELTETVRRAYRFCGAEENLQVNYYPAFTDPASRTKNENMPTYGLTSGEYYKDYSYVIVSDHSFRQAPALHLLKQAFQIDN